MIFLIASAVAGPNSAEMHERLAKLVEARDHVVQGQLDDAKTVAGLLAEQPTRDAPDDWKSAMRKITRTSRKASRAKDLVSAADGVGRVAQACGECHTATGAKVLEHDLPPQVWDEGQNMALHKWATDWLWLGLVAGDDAAWQRGARSLVEQPIELRFQDAPAPTDQPQLEQLLYIVAERATTTASNYRGEVMGQMLATCSECHVTERDAKP